MWFKIQGYNFGLCSAVVRYNALAELLTRASVRLLPVVSCHYFDDWCIVEPDFCGRSGAHSLASFFELCGFPLARGQPRLLRDGSPRFDSGGSAMRAKDKSAPSALSNAFLGVVFGFEQFRGTGKLTTSVEQSKIDRARAFVSDALATKLLPSATAASLCGKLRYCASWALGRFGRAALQPLYARAGERRSRARLVSASIEASLHFFQRAFQSSLRRVISVDPATRAPPVLVWSDAMWQADAQEPARLGFVVCVPRAVAPDGTVISEEYWLHSYAVVDDDLRGQWEEREQYITHLELLAAIAVYSTLPDTLRGRDVIHWIDNTGALAILAKSYSADHDAARMVHAWEVINLGVRANTWFEYVRSEANIADLPSRGEYGYLEQELGSSPVLPMLLPSLSGWDQSDIKGTDAPRQRSRKRSRA